MAGIDHKQASGTAQDNRLLPALRPRSAKIDERSFGDLLMIARQYARLIQYYNLDEVPLGSWEPFFEKNASFFLAEILMTKAETWDEEVQGIIRNIFAVYLPAKSDQASYSYWLEPKQELVLELAVKVLDLALLLNHWYERALELERVEEGTAVTQILHDAIQSRLSRRVRIIYYWLDVLEEQYTTVLKAEQKRPKDDFHEIWDLRQSAKNLDIFTPEGALDTVLNFAVEDFRRSFEQLFQSLIYVLSISSDLLEEDLNQRHDHQPDLGLMMAFLKSFGFAQEHLNTLTRRHLSHYFEDLLQLVKKPAQPDWTFVGFTLNNQLQEHFLPQGTLLLAGVNEQGVPSHYQTLDPLMVSRAKIAALKTLYVSKYPLVDIGSSYKTISGIFAAPVANSKDGRGAPFVVEQPLWAPFGEEQLDKARDERNMEHARVGWAIASPVLALAQGYRHIDVRMRFTPASYEVLSTLIRDIAKNRQMSVEAVVDRIFTNSMHFYLTGPEGWFLVPKPILEKEAGTWDEPDIFFRISLPIEAPPVLANTPVVAEPPYSTDLPVLKVELMSEESAYIYSFLQRLELEEINITTEVTGLKDLQLINEAGPLDNSAPFLPFGPLPTSNSYLLIGSAELFGKRLQSLKLKLEWNNLPKHEAGFQGYFAEYGERLEVDNSSYNFYLSALSNHHFQPLALTDQQCFSLFSAEAADGPLEVETVIEEIDVSRLEIQPNYQRQELPPYSNTLDSGYFRLQLAEPEGMFGHRVYPIIFAEAMLANAQLKKNEEATPLPAEPFAPMLRQLSVDYKASTTINFRDLEFRKNDVKAAEKVYHLEPFGLSTIFANGKARQRYLVPYYAYQGYLFIGLENLHLPQALQLFFEIEESQKRFSNAEIDMEWCVLYQDEWIKLREEHLLSDGTYGFTTSGIVSIELPEEMSLNNSSMPGEYYWLRIAVQGDLDIIGKVRALVPHAAKVEWVDNGDIEHFSPEVTLPVLAELAKTTPEIAGVQQLYPFQGRNPLESTTAYYVRASERLRHKSRSVQIWDWERIVLEHFPDVQQVKCVGVFGNERAYQMEPGSVKVVVVPRYTASDRRPKAGFRLLQEVQQFLEEKASPFVRVQVINPQYEFVKISCSIVLPEDLFIAKGKYRKQLEDDLRLFICPWLNGTLVDFGGQLAKNDILNFIRSRPYIKFISRFSVVQIFEQVFAKESDFFDLSDTALVDEKTEVIQATTPWSVLVPVEQHDIQFLPSEEYITPEIAAIENMQLGTDFIVVAGDENDDVTEHEPPEELAGPDSGEEDDWFLTN